MKFTLILTAVALLLLASSSASVHCYNPCGFIYNSGSFDTFSYPGARTTVPEGISDNGQIVGYYDAHGTHGFSYRWGGSFTTIDRPRNFQTLLLGVNNNGDIVGYSTSGSFLHSGDSFTAIDYPGALPLSTVAWGINANGDIAGFYHSNSTTHGFLDFAGVFSSLNYPGALATLPRGINDNRTIVGYYLAGSLAQSHSYGFIESGGLFTSVNYPGASGTALVGINDQGQAVGSSTTCSFFVFDGVTFTCIAYRGHYLSVSGINDSGQIVGYYLDYAVPELPSFLLFGSALLGNV